MEKTIEKNPELKLKVSTRGYERLLIIQLEGNLTRETLPLVKKVTQFGMEKKVSSIVFDLERLDYIDYQSLNYFMDLFIRLTYSGGQLNLTRVPVPIYEEFELIQLNHYMPINIKRDREIDSLTSFIDISLENLIAREGILPVSVRGDWSRVQFSGLE
ncbi:STAS domain-containing protein [Candidatus Riflebacteria bacterium]